MPIFTKIVYVSIGGYKWNININPNAFINCNCRQLGESTYSNDAKPDQCLHTFDQYCRHFYRTISSPLWLANLMP